MRAILSVSLVVAASAFAQDFGGTGSSDPNFRASTTLIEFTSRR